MTALVPFDYEGQPIRTVTIDGAPEFVAADVCRVLEHSNPSAAVAGLDDDERGLRNVETPSGTQSMVTVTEAGLYSLIIRSRKPEAKAFRRWITHTVLPEIRRTGGYGPARFEIPQDYPSALRAAAEQAERAAAAEARAAELEGPAASWEHLASTDGDLSVNEAAKVLSRDPGVTIGERRLWAWLDEHRWTYRDANGDRRGYQNRIESGHLTARARSHHHPATGELIVDAPQVRIPMKGIELIRRHLTSGITAAIA